jgi:hypothetical protein
VLDLSAPIMPEQSAAGIAIGDAAEVLPAPLARRPLSSGERLDYGPVLVWLQDGKVSQVAVREGYMGTLAGDIRIGSSLADVERVFGAVAEDDEDNLIVPSRPGCCFETEEWRGPRLGDNIQARITEIFVYKQRAGEQSVEADEGS